MKIKYTSEKFIKLAKEKYNDFFDYSLVHKDFKNIASKVRIICPKHGEFIQNANNHLNGYGCKFCNKENLNGNSKYTGAVLLAKFNELYNEKYSYNLNLDEQYRVTDKINFICFETSGMSLIASNNFGISFPIAVDKALDSVLG